MLESLPTITQQDILIAAIVLVGLYILKRFSGIIKTVITNTIAGVVVLFAAQTAGLSLAFTPLTIGIAAIAGLPGGVLVVLLTLAGFDVQLPS